MGYNVSMDKTENPGRDGQNIENSDTIIMEENNSIPQGESAQSGSEVDSRAKKKLPFLLRLLRGILVLALVLILALAVVFAVCALNKRDALSAIPKDFSFYAHTDSAFRTLDPMLDLQAADVFLASPEFRSLRPIFVELRSSPVRKNSAFARALSRPVDMALYDGIVESGRQNFLALVDLGGFSLATRPLRKIYTGIYPKVRRFVQPILDENKIEIEFVQDEVFSYFVLKTEGGVFYASPSKNLLAVSDSSDLLMMSMMAANDIAYTSEQKKFFSRKSDGLRVVANAKKLAASFTEQNDVLGKIAGLLPDDEFSVVSLRISDSDISIDAKIPFSVDSENPTALDPLLTKNSTVPSILSKMGDIVQYYTVLNAGTLEELKSAVFPLMPVENADSLWARGNLASRLAFSMTLEELLFSWTGKEFVALGIENQNDPVFAVQVSDEKKRAEVFGKFASSILIKEDDSLILGGARLPRLRLPSFLNGILSVMGISIPKPYYMVLDGYAYFSESAEALSAVYAASKSENTLIKSEMWRKISRGMKNDSAVTLFYDLARSVPFFLRSSASMSKVLELYKTGRFDVKIGKGEISLVLQANSSPAVDLRAVPGFPIQLGKDAEIGSFVCENSDSPENVFWREGSALKVLNLKSLDVKTFENLGNFRIAPFSGKSKDAALWAITQEGYVYLFDRNLEVLPNFPLVVPEKTTLEVSPSEFGLVVPLSSGSLLLVDSDGGMSTIQMPEISVKSPPTVLGNVSALYNKSFLGTIHFADLKKKSASDASLSVGEIAFGSPALVAGKKGLFTVFVTQAGTLLIWDGSGLEPVVAKDLGGTFEGNLVSDGKYVYCISTDATLHRIDLNGEDLCVRIPNATAKNAYISVRQKSGKPCVFVNADSNVIYAFDSNLELLAGFPVAGSGNPVIADVNGDKSPEVLSMSLDRKINAYRMR